MRFAGDFRANESMETSSETLPRNSPGGLTGEQRL